MSYVSAELIDNGDTVLVWERGPNGRTTKQLPAPYYFYIASKDGEFTSLHGQKLKRYDFDSRAEFSAAKKDFLSSGITLFESDLSPIHKALSEHYHNVEAPTLNVSFYDIEVDYNPEIGFAGVDNPYAPINSIAFYHEHENTFVLYAVPPKLEDTLKFENPALPKNGEFWTEEELYDAMHEIAELPENTKLVLTLCSNEKELLLSIIAEIEDSDIIAGWNSEWFDFPYIYERIKRVLGVGYTRKLEFPEATKTPRKKTVEVFGREQTTYESTTRISADYLALFKKYEMNERPSYKLEAIADEIVPELPKLSYEGSLASLYKQNFPYFIRYNLRDTEVLDGFEKKLGYVALANEMYHLSCGTFGNVAGTIKLAELAIVNYCHHELDVVVNDNIIDETGGSIQGAYVLTPKTGMHDWIGSIDINSLYPSAIRSINISPETLIGQFVEKTRACEEIAKSSLCKLALEFENGEVLEATASEWREILLDKKWAVSGYGTVFTQKKKGVIPAILESWYATRKKYQRLKAEALENNDKQKSAYYDRLQYVYKIKLNSLYGALNNKHFRFYDLRMGESTTGTGRMILTHQCAKTNEILSGTYDPTGDSVLYGDTDSTYFAIGTSEEKESILVADAVGQKVTDSYPQFMRDTFLCTEGFDDIVKAGREVVASRGIFVDKKRYVLRVIDNEGEKVDKLKVMGLDTKKTTLPKPISKQLNKFVERLLKGEEWDTIATDIVEYKENLHNTTDVFSIGLPKGVNKVEYYTDEFKYNENTRLPGHVAATIFYNNCLEEYGDKESLAIVSGMKIKVFYLKSKQGKFKSIALPTDTVELPKWFKEKFIDLIDRDAQIQRLVDNPLENIIKAINKEVPSRQSLYVDSMLEF